MPCTKDDSKFNPDRDIPLLHGKVILVTGGTSGLGAESVRALAKHKPEHIYFTGRNTTAANSLVHEITAANPDTSLSFMEMDMASLNSVRNAVRQHFTHDQLHILMCNAGIMAVPSGTTEDGFEIQFGVNHLAHALLIRELSPVLLKTAEQPDSDVRLVSLTSTGWRGHPKGGIVFDQLRTTQDSIGGSWIRYGQSKLANILYAAEFARRNPSVVAVSVHPGVVATDLVNNLSAVKKAFVYSANWATGTRLMSPEEGVYSQLWSAAGAKKSEIINGAFYMPIGVESNHLLDNVAKDADLAQRLWHWTEDALATY